MSDDLRTRIIAALLSEDDVALMADAVIQELGLRKDTLRTRIAAVLDGYVDPGHRYDLADAVIRELGPLVRYWDKDFKELHYCRECGGWGPKDD